MDNQQVVNDKIQKLCNDFTAMFLGQTNNSLNGPHTKTDAVLSNLRKITINDITFIEKELDYYEKVSLIFLLYDNTEEASKLFYDENQNFLNNWVQNEMRKNSQDWQNKILEALCIIKNYSILRELGYDQKELIARFMPKNFSTSLYVQHVKKALYIACENMNITETKQFLQKLRQDFVNKSVPFQIFPEKYLELYFLHCFNIKYIKHNDLSNIIKILKEMNLETISHSLSSVSSTRNVIEQDNIRENNYIPRVDNDTLSTYTSEASNFSLPRYHMDPKKAGICLIINQENFKIYEGANKVEIPWELHDKQLERRKGTHYDKQRLKNTFENFGFRIKIYDDLCHNNMISKIKETMNDFGSNDCCFITCILSHGQPDRVFGCDSIPVQISAIEDAIHDKRFKNILHKPKVLIIQSCQGNKLQEAIDLSVYNTVDGQSQKVTAFSPSLGNYTDAPKITPERCDLLVCTSTIPGYASVRNELQGSWYIQELCSVLKAEAHRKHMLDILTLVSNHVTQKYWKMDGKNKCMVPGINTTLRKHLFLVPPEF